jgi:RNA polymerase sigma factor (sigma-70 family)
MDTQTKLDLVTRIFAEHEPAIRAMIRHHARSRDEEEDIYQNLYLSLVCNPIPAPLTNTLAYLDTVIKNDIIDAARRRKSHREMLDRYVAGYTPEPSQSDPQEAAIRAEEIRRVAEFVQTSLPAHEARAVLERYGHGRGTADAAQSMQVKKRTVSRYLCRGLKRIREAVGGFEVEDSICP